MAVNKAVFTNDKEGFRWMDLRYHFWFPGPICGVQGIQKLPYVLERNVEVIRDLEEARGWGAEATAEKSAWEKGWS